MTFRDDKYQAREDLHQALSEPAYYYESRAAAPRVVTVRLHLHFNAMGDLKNGGFADWNEKTPEIIFWAAEVTPVNNAYVVTKTEGVFMINDTDPVDGVTRKAKVISLDTPSSMRLGWDPRKPWCGLPAPE